MSASARSGFTLIELMVVVVILAILAPAIVIQFGGAREKEILHSTARDLVGLLRLASSRAISSCQASRVRLDRSRGRYWIEEVDSTDRRSNRFVPSQAFANLSGKVDRRIEVLVRPRQQSRSRGEDVHGRNNARRKLNDSDRDAIAFYPDCTAEEKEIVLRDRLGEEVLIKIHPITSRIEIVTHQTRSRSAR